MISEIEVEMWKVEQAYPCGLGGFGGYRPGVFWGSWILEILDDGFYSGVSSENLPSSRAY